jgi:hypothetical protein
MLSYTARYGSKEHRYQTDWKVISEQVRTLSLLIDEKKEGNKANRMLKERERNEKNNLKK